MLITIVITALVCALVVTTALAYHYRGEADFALELLNESTASFLKMTDETHDQVVDLVNENKQLRTDLRQYIGAAMFDAFTIRNMATSIEVLNSELEASNIRYAERFLNAVATERFTADDVYMPEDDCTCPFSYDDRIEAPCKDASCTCVHHKFSAIKADEL